MQLPDTDDEFLRPLMAQTTPMPADWLAGRIVARATALPQKQGFLRSLKRAFTEWDYALNVKGMALAGFAMLGLLGAVLSDGQGTLDLSNVMLADPNWTEEL